MNNRLPFELKKPGTWLTLPDRQTAFEVESLLSLVSSSFAEATTALILFENDQRGSASCNTTAEWERDRRIRDDVRQSVEAESNLNAMTASWELREALNFEVDVQVLRTNIAQGNIPRSILHRIPFIHAKAFLNAADSLGRVLSKLGEHPATPEGARDVASKYYALFPALREVRNTTQHVEDRGRGLGKGGKPLELKPIDNRMIKAPGGALVIDALNGNCFGSTMADGHYGEVEVSATSITAMRDLIESLFNEFQWTGSPRLELS